jgi:chromosome segregation ATPase
MSEEPTKKQSNLSVPGEAKIKKGLVKLDLSCLEGVIQDLFDQDQVLRAKIDNLEIILNRDDQLEMMKRNIERLEQNSDQHLVSIGNIQAKIIDIEQRFLKMETFSKGMETEIKVARNAEKDTRNALKREVKIINSKINEAEKRLPEITQQFSRPLEEKLIMAYS